MTNVRTLIALKTGFENVESGIIGWWDRASTATNTAEMIARLPGASSAPPTPCSMRPAISHPSDGAAAHVADATANQTMPKLKMRRRPKRSPRAPPSRMNDASVSVYPVTTHCSPAKSAWRSAPIRGSATLTTVPSSIVMPDPRTVAASTQCPWDVRSRMLSTPVSVAEIRLFSRISSGDARNDLPSDQVDHLEVGVEQVLEHHALHPRLLERPQLGNRLVDRPEHQRGGVGPGHIPPRPLRHLPDPVLH